MILWDVTNKNGGLMVISWDFMGKINNESLFKWGKILYNTTRQTSCSARHTLKRQCLDHDLNLNTLWLFNIAMENDPFIDDFPIKTIIYKGFSMAMLNDQMVYSKWSSVAQTFYHPTLLLFCASCDITFLDRKVQWTSNVFFLNCSFFAST